MVVGMGSALGTFPTGAQDARIVSAGIRWFDMSSEQIEQALVAVIPVASDNVMADGEIITHSEIFSHPLASVETNKNNGQAYICKPNESANEFRTIDAGTAAIENTQFDGVFIGVMGNASKTYIGVEMIIHYELIIDVFSNTPGTVTNATQSSPNLLVARLWQAGFASGLIDANTKAKLEAYVKAKAKKAAITLIRTGVNMGVNYLTAGTAPRALLLN
jgi:hypothetical protein